MFPLAVYSPSALTSSNPPDLSSAAYRFLAEGDSWFSIGSLNLAKNSNLLHEMVFERLCCAVNCAEPGDTLRRMVSMNHDRHFRRLLWGRLSRPWDAMVMSCGGNDLIEAVQVRGASIPQQQRLLLTAAEWGPPRQGAARYLSEAGWQTFCTYMRANFDRLVGLRDRGPSAGCPVFFHGYAYPTPRPAGTGFGMGPWLYPSLVAYAVPQSDFIALATELIRRLVALLASVAADIERFPNLHFFDTSAIAVQPAALNTTGTDGDWVNEIHLTWRGYEKLALPWAAAIEKTMVRG